MLPSNDSEAAKPSKSVPIAHRCSTALLLLLNAVGHWFSNCGPREYTLLFSYWVMLCLTGLVSKDDSPRIQPKKATATPVKPQEGKQTSSRQTHVNVMHYKKGCLRFGLFSNLHFTRNPVCVKQQILFKFECFI
jgi:hypothetical protein